MRRLARILVLLLALPGPALDAFGADPSAPVRGAIERIEVDGQGGRRLVEGVVVVEAVDGGLLVERADERLELLQPRDIVSRTAAPRAAGGIAS